MFQDSSVVTSADRLCAKKWTVVLEKDMFHWISTPCCYLLDLHTRAALSNFESTWAFTDLYCKPCSFANILPASCWQIVISQESAAWHRFSWTLSDADCHIRSCICQQGHAKPWEREMIKASFGWSCQPGNCLRTHRTPLCKIRVQTHLRRNQSPGSCREDGASAMEICKRGRHDFESWEST